MSSRDGGREEGRGQGGARGVRALAPDADAREHARESLEDVAVIGASGVVDGPWYRQAYPDVDLAEIDPVVHYAAQGWRELRDPGPLFSTRYYLEANGDVAESGRNPLAHYLTQGWREGRLPRDGFVPPPGAESVPDVCPLVLALATGQPWGPGQEQAAPGTAPAVGEPGPPGSAGRRPEPPLRDLAVRAARPAGEPPGATPLRTVAFYLPQFHPVPENDAWWGEGFTEWTNVVRGRERVQGQHQPHVPGELGYYDLRDPHLMRRQVELATLHGVSAFCFYAYWFGGTRLLERPLDAFLADPTLEIDFCVCWANENWTRTWDGAADEVLVGQRHSPADDVAFIADMARYLRDPRYLRVGGRPLLLVYRPSLLPDPAATAARWRAWCRDDGVGEVVLAYVQSFDLVDPRDIGFDYAVEFPPNNTDPVRVTDLEPVEEFSGTVYDWVGLARRSEAYQTPAYPLWRGTCPSWDNEARRPGRGTLLLGSDPAEFRGWMVRAGRDTLARFARADERLVFVNAWNEWAEGAHLEPDGRYGYRWLHAVRDAQEALAGIPPTETGPGVVVVTHDLHPHGAQMLALHMVRMLRRLGRRVEAVSLGPGDMQGRYEAEAPLLVLDGEVLGGEAFDDTGPDDTGPDGAGLGRTVLQRVAADLVARGFTTALCNTSVSGHLAAALAAAGAHVVGLVHEMPGVLADPVRAGAAASLAGSAHRAVFASEKVREGFPFPLHGSCEVVIRPQGLYLMGTEAPTDADRAVLRRSLGLGPDAVVVLGVGFGDHRKGLDLFAEASAAADRPGREVCYVWVGKPDGYDPRITRALAAAEGAPLHLAGFVDDLPRYYRGADVLALPSREDPYPSVVLEAMAAGLPVVAFRGRTGLEGLLREGAGVLVDDVSADGLRQGVLAALAADDAGARAARRALVAGRYNFRRYVMDLLAGTPAALARVSAVVPSYRYAPLLADRIGQVLGQSHPVYELVVLDDASGDGSVEVAREALRGTDVPCRLVVNEANSGSVYRQWARGAALTTGDLVWIAEADDVAHPDLLALLVPAFRRPGTAMAYCESRQLGPDGEELAPDYREYVADVPGRDRTRRYAVPGDDEVAVCLAVKNTVPNASAVLFDGGVLRDVLPRVVEDAAALPSAGDYLVYAHVLRHGRLVFEPEALNGHRRHAGSVVASNLGRSHLKEIMTMQARVQALVDVGEEARAARLAYDMRLYEQLGLGPAGGLLSDPDLSGLVATLQAPRPSRGATAAGAAAAEEDRP